MAAAGFVSPTGKDVGPFAAIEQSAIAQLTEGADDVDRTRIFARFEFCGYVGCTLGALAAGVLIAAMQSAGWSDERAYRGTFVFYIAVAVVVGMAYGATSNAIEPLHVDGASILPGALPRSGRTVVKLCMLFLVDAFGDGLIAQSLLALFLQLRFGVSASVIAFVFFWTGVTAGASQLLADRVAARCGLINTMVFTHLPSSLLLIAVVFAPDFRVAAVLLVLRCLFFGSAT